VTEAIKPFSDWKSGVGKGGIPGKTTPRVIPGFPRKAFHPGEAPPGGAGSARPRERLGLDRRMAPLGHRAFLCSR